MSLFKQCHCFIKVRIKYYSLKNFTYKLRRKSYFLSRISNEFHSRAQAKVCQTASLNVLEEVEQMSTLTFVQVSM